MIDVAAAGEILKKAVPTPVVVRLPLIEASGFIVAKDIYSPFPMPLFDQSAVDGYVLLNGPFGGIEQFPVVGEIKAGDPAPRTGNKPVAYRIFTGAPVPKRAWCVVMQERVTADEHTVHAPVEYQVRGSNIRLQGNHFKRKDLLIRKGDRLTPISLALLASIGKSTVAVFTKPVVGIIVTGNELTPVGLPLQPGRIYESNSYLLHTALRDAGFSVVLTQSAVDTRKTLDRALKKAISACDAIILTGGISVGKYDLVYESLRAAGVHELFYKVAQKPGKPFFAGKRGRTMYFALPGNPAAVAVCFHRYVLPTLLRMAGQATSGDNVFRLPLLTDYEVRGDRDLFLRALTSDEGVQLLSGQDSDNLFSFAHADALVYLSCGQRLYRKGDLVEVMQL